MNIEKLRSEIDAVDEAIVELLEHRAAISKKIGAIKAQAGLPVFDRRREAAVLSGINRRAAGTFGAAAMERIFTEILFESRRLQKCVVPEAKTLAERAG